MMRLDHPDVTSKQKFTRGEKDHLRPHPYPLPRTILLEAVDLHRDLWCEHYEDCLGEAVARDWASWSCLGCPLRGQAQIKPELRTGGDGALAQAVETATGAYSPDGIRSRCRSCEEAE